MVMDEMMLVITRHAMPCHAMPCLAMPFLSCPSPFLRYAFPKKRKKKASPRPIIPLPRGRNTGHEKHTTIKNRKPEPGWIMKMNPDTYY